ncbi:hypothetical protein BGZ60DRAFT_397826 [Tricladium varicosporioides]|nr:hypothetical protein BGZ60DRAFT_397826 [Hymenoscyphus varicosporioides]
MYSKMEHTVIKIPGKRTRDTSKQAKEARKALKRPSGRPLKLDSSRNPRRDSASMAVTKFKSKAPQEKLVTIFTASKVALLEKLPTELMREIYFLSMNLSLPRSSSIIGSVLSSESVYSWTIDFAFATLWGKWHGDFYRTKHEPPNEYSEMQSAILRCRWATLSRLLKAKDSWRKKQPFEEQPSTLCRWFCAPAYGKGKNDLINFGHVPTHIISEEEYLDEDYLMFCKFTANQYVGQPVSFMDTADVEHCTEIPESLLLGPWSDAQMRYLYWVVKSGARIDWLRSTSGETALTGMRNAIIEGDTRAIILLGWAGVSGKIDENMIIFALRESGSDKVRVFNHLLLLIDSAGWNSKISVPNIKGTLDEIKIKARQRKDKERLKLVKDIRQSPWFERLVEMCDFDTAASKAYPTKSL